ncbi:MAG TPA: hypothetical protein VEB19_18495 [Gemmatimonadaceae bacterium]|nr:hypothetical protein [Gemmatimonadaceae bacterium]
MTRVLEFGKRVATVVLLGAVSACATLGRSPEVAEEDRATVSVDNRSYVDMTIYVVEGGASRRRLGTVSAAMRSTFVIPQSIVGNGREVMFLADPIGGARSSVSQRIWVGPGEQVVLMIPPQ